MNPNLRLLAALLLALPLLACVAADDGDHVTVIQEYEPNDASSSATILNGGTGVYSFFGHCSAAANDAADWFEVDGVVAGNIESTLYVSGQDPNAQQDPFAAAAPVIALSMMDSADSVIGEAPEVTPSTPAKIVASLPGGGVVRLKLSCGADQAYYLGTVKLP